MAEQALQAALRAPPAPVRQGMPDRRTPAQRWADENWNEVVTLGTARGFLFAFSPREQKAIAEREVR